MRTSQWTMIGLAVAGMAIGSIANADTPAYRVRLIREATSADLIKVGTAWRKDLPKRIHVSLRVQENKPSSAVSVKAYFYDKDNQLVASGVKPSEIWTNTKHGFDTVLLPPTLEHGKDVDVFFALTPELAAKKWKAVVVVFGDAKQVAARSFPSTLLPKLDFPEKKILIDDKSDGD
ncbi:MAG: hypothetical protein PHQ12_02310 [Chthoniobacteraceae bacterium]|nr:hypothetical protein [Chthoniobacteraceae bacterium]